MTTPDVVRVVVGPGIGRGGDDPLGVFLDRPAIPAGRRGAVAGGLRSAPP